MAKLLTTFTCLTLILGFSTLAGAAQEVETERSVDIPSRVSVAATQTYDPDKWTVVGSIREHRVQGRESLLEIARDHSLGYREITMVNPDLSQFLPGDGASVLLPTARILPPTPFDHGIVMNLVEKRLYYFYSRNGEKLVISFPIGIGAATNDTPLGDFNITRKLTEPSWTVPASAREKRPNMPAIVPPGPDNPMGSHALQLSDGSYFIHGTNRPWSIGRRATLGCTRLYPEDIPVLFRMVPSGTPVRVINQAVKVGRQQDRVYLEVHQNEHDDKQWRDYRDKAKELLTEKGWINDVDLHEVAAVSRRGAGIPVLIGRISQD